MLGTVTRAGDEAWASVHPPELSGTSVWGAGVLLLPLSTWVTPGQRSPGQRSPGECPWPLVWPPSLLLQQQQPLSPAHTQAVGSARPGQGQNFSALPGQRVDNEEALGTWFPSTQGCSCGAKQCVALGTDI